MPIDLSWYIPNRIIRAHVYDEAGVVQLKKMMNDARPFLDEGSAPIHLILDDATAEPPPLSIKEFKAILEVEKRPIDKLGWVIGIGDTNPIAKIVLPVLLKVLKIKYIRVSTLGEATAFLSKQDMSLRKSISSTNKGT